jgi:hypothetical protein
MAALSILSSKDVISRVGCQCAAAKERKKGRKGREEFAHPLIATENTRVKVCLVGKCEQILEGCQMGVAPWHCRCMVQVMFQVSNEGNVEEK